MCLHATALFTAQVAEAPLGLPKANTWNENAEQAPLLRALLQELFLCMHGFGAFWVGRRVFRVWDVKVCRHIEAYKDGHRLHACDWD